MAATDAQNDELTFTITSYNAISNTDNAFAINAGTGELTMAGALNHETTAVYTLTVNVLDRELSAATEIIIDVNDAPIITA